MKTQDAHDAATQALIDDAPGVLPLEGLPDVVGAVRRALEVCQPQHEPTSRKERREAERETSPQLEPDLIACEEIRAQVWAQARVLKLTATLGQLIAEHPDIKGLVPAMRGALVIQEAHDTAHSLRHLIRHEIMCRVEQLVLRELARIVPNPTFVAKSQGLSAEEE